MRIKKTQIFILITLIIILLVSTAGYFFYRILSPCFNIEEPVSIYIDETKKYDKLLSDLNTIAHVKDLWLFQKLASFKKYNESNMRTGRYVIYPSMSALSAINIFRNGQQTPVKITFNNVRLKNDFAEKIGEQFMFDQEKLLEKLNDPEICKSFGFNTETIISMFIPNTYEMYWNAPVNIFLERMKKEYDRFWTLKRLEKAKAIPLTPVQVAVLASIVEEECTFVDEYPAVAGLYINRLRKGMRLEADPTIKFALNDFTLRRILFIHLEADSPYNTYKYSGLPPGPIRIPSIAGIDAVLNYSKHNYLFMCAKDDFSGRHAFTVTYAEHLRNARQWQEELNRRNIR